MNDKPIISSLADVREELAQYSTQWAPPVITAPVFDPSTSTWTRTRFMVTVDTNRERFVVTVHVVDEADLTAQGEPAHQDRNDALLFVVDLWNGAIPLERLRPDGPGRWTMRVEETGPARRCNRPGCFAFNQWVIYNPQDLTGHLCRAEETPNMSSFGLSVEWCDTWRDRPAGWYVDGVMPKNGMTHVEAREAADALDDAARIAAHLNDEPPVTEPESDREVDELQALAEKLTVSDFAVLSRRLGKRPSEFHALVFAPIEARVVRRLADQCAEPEHDGIGGGL